MLLQSVGRTVDNPSPASESLQSMVFSKPRASKYISLASTRDAVHTLCLLVAGVRRIRFLYDTRTNYKIGNSHFLFAVIFCNSNIFVFSNYLFYPLQRGTARKPLFKKRKQKPNKLTHTHTHTKEKTETQKCSF